MSRLISNSSNVWREESGKLAVRQWGRTRLLRGLTALSDQVVRRGDDIDGAP